MKQKYLQFLLRLTVMTAIIGLAGFLLQTFLPANTISPLYPYILILFYVVTALIHLVLLNITRLNPRRFVSYYMLATFVKLILYFTAVLIYVFTYRVHVLAFIITFFVSFIFFMVFVVVLILRQTKDI